MKKIFAIKDTKIGFDKVFTAQNEAVAMRMFIDACNDTQTMINMHPEDFELYTIAKFDENTGETEKCVTFLDRATSFVKKSKK